MRVCAGGLGPSDVGNTASLQGLLLIPTHSAEVPDQPLSFLFDFFMLYQTTNEIEKRSYHLRSADLAWQTIWAFVGIIAATYPIGPIGIFWRPMLVCIVYLYSALAPEGATMSPFGLFTMSVKWWPYFLIAIDVILGGPGYALISVTGAVVGHVWWWSVWGGRLGGQGLLARYAQAPEWLRNLIGESPQNRPPNAGGAAEGLARGGIHVTAPRRTLNNPDQATTSGHRWGSGNRLGNS
ncbi:hypothetical protein CVT24_003008 [Panaeolus cyanescens]|uniref:Derlin n=1 Tax=Panaeolus cyanescens TaxID=181874 RepID=A0A409VFT8_9AGAR|nr:hypothetical protein CVT24_003008 [Panaeolus cyanescens]